eukprot:CAMPEP_0115525728 /NCGR_PEP_ID=MMETSP0271-20121206/81903_1 /TAXON_ID=71861 /ORGANISM="Scrippsiella trochoidea, Strain CCMP3099" /LENGTH=149 /DNA_ID=CAMNT_0002957383 /DNA_START=23 /DNA_END=472 /DNA_ORIENTATION=+
MGCMAADDTDISSGRLEHLPNPAPSQREEAALPVGRVFREDEASGLVLSEVQHGLVVAILGHVLVAAEVLLRAGEVRRREAKLEALDHLAATLDPDEALGQTARVGPDADHHAGAVHPEGALLRPEPLGKLFALPDDRLRRHEHEYLDA